jgi:prepilin-type N-terminal cleavage/methylation domain-containing protein
MTQRDMRGFTLIEMLIVILVLGTVVGFSVPGIKIMMGTQNLKGAADNITGQLRLARQKAIATGATQTVHFYLNTFECDYHIHNGSVVDPKWDLPNGITYWTGTGFVADYTFNSDGTCSNSGNVFLQNPKGKRDTVSVSVSGLILHL